jgi:hypothetical protein
LFISPYTGEATVPDNPKILLVDYETPITASLALFLERTGYWENFTAGKKRVGYMEAVLAWPW